MINNVKKVTQENLLNVFEWILFITLCIIALLFMKEVLIQFNSGDTSFKQYESTISESPAITLCLNKFWSDYSWEHTYGLDFNISYHIDDDFVLLSLEDDTFNSDKEEIIQVQLLNTIWFGKCYKISTKSNSHTAVYRGYSQDILVEYDESIPLSNLPMLTIYFTSEKNAYGIMFSEWMDGEVQEFKIENNVYEEISLRPERYIYLKAKSKCFDESFYECFGLNFLSNNFNGCPRKCLPDYTFLLNAKYEEEQIAACQTEDESECSMEIAKSLFVNITETNVCLKPCSILQYSGIVKYKERLDVAHSVQFKYRFANPQSVKVHEEYLIYDMIGLIGSVGGTLGIFIGFSFTCVVTSLINFLKKLSCLNNRKIMHTVNI